MSNTGNHFRTVAFGGFHKQDVLNYITAVSKERQERDADLTQSAQRAQQELKSLTAKYEIAEAARKKNSEECQRLSETLTQRTAALEQAQRELADLQAEYAQASARLNELEEKLPALEESAEAYAALKDHTATIELEAHRKAQETIDQANAQADKIRGEVGNWLHRVQSTYQHLRGDLSAMIAHLGSELERSKNALDETVPALRQHDETLAALLEREQMAGPKASEPLPLEEEENDHV